LADPSPPSSPSQSPSQTTAAGQEILVVDADDQVVKGLDRLLTRVGLIVTGTADPIRARDQLLNKFFAVALVDADTPTPGGGLELLQYARDKSPLTSIIVMTARKSYEVAVRAFRGGAVDVVVKEPDVVPYLRERVLEAAIDLRTTGERNTLLEEIAETHEEFLRRMRDMAKEAVDLEDRLTGRTASESEGAGGETTVVVVDDDPEALPRLQKVLTAAAGWELQLAHTGGEGLDVVSQTRPHIVMVKEQLPDLPGSMVVKTVKTSAPDAVTLLYSPPQPGSPGEVKLVDTNRTMNLVSSYTAADQLVSPMSEIREAIRQKTKERRYLQAFRQKNYEFLQRYNSLKQRIKAALDKGKK
jgi:DNA-binding NtrC family response regulator